MVWNAIRLKVIRDASSLQLFEGELKNASRSLDQIQ